MYTVYAFGNGYLLYGMFQAIALFFKNNNIGVLFTILALIAAIYYAIRVTIYHQHSLLSTAKYVIVFSIILTGLVYNQTTVIVKDVANPGAPTNAQPISNVPWGIAVIWSDFTTIQYGLAKDFTNDFSVPAGDNMLSEGLGVSIIQQADSATISTSNSYLYQDYNQYVSNCVAPGVESGNLNASSLLSAGDATNTASATYQPNNAASIWQIMSSYTSNTGAGGGGNMLTEWYSGTGANSTTFEASGATYQNGTSTTCAQETTWLQTAVQDYINQVAGPAIAGGEGFANAASYDNSLGTMNSFLLNVQQSGQNQLFQAIGVNMYAPAILKMAQVAGVNANGLAYATGTAENSTNSSMFISGILAGKYMPIVFGLFEAIVLIASVIILILIATHMGLKYVKLLFEIMLMITIWPSLTAGFNYITQLIIQSQYATYSGIGYSVSGSGGITNYFDSALSWMGYLSWTVPMMAYAIASGSSYAMTSMVSDLSSGLKTNSATEALSKGNGSFGVMNGDNMNMNKFDVTHTHNTGYRAPNFTNEYGAKTEDSINSKGGVTHKTTSAAGNSISTTSYGPGVNTTEEISANGNATMINAKGSVKAEIGQDFKAINEKKYLHAQSKVSTLTQKINDTKETTTKLSNELSALQSTGVNAGNGGQTVQQGQVLHNSKGAYSHKVANARSYKNAYTQGSGIKADGGVSAGSKGEGAGGANAGIGTEVAVGHNKSWTHTKTTTNANTVASSNNNNAAISANLVRKYGSVKNAENAISAKLSSSDARLQKLENMRSEEERNEQKYAHSIAAVSSKSGGVSSSAMPYILNLWANEHGYSGQNAVTAENTEWLKFQKENGKNPAALDASLSHIVDGELGTKSIQRKISSASSPITSSVKNHGVNPGSFKIKYNNENYNLNSKYSSEGGYFSSLYNQNSNSYLSLTPQGDNSFTGTKKFTDEIYGISSYTPTHDMPSLSYKGAQKEFKSIEDNKPLPTPTIGDFNKQEIQKRLNKDGVRPDGLVNGGEWLISEGWKGIAHL